MPDLEIIFINHPETEEYFHGYNYLIEQLEKSLNQVPVKNYFKFFCDKN